MRTCIGCRQCAEAVDLVRLVLRNGQVSPAPRTRRSGRGASIHPREACVVAAVRTRAFARAFRAAVAPGGEPPDVARNPGTGRLKHHGKIGATSDLKLDEAVKTLIKDIEIAHVLQQPRAGRTP
ncbi:MAG: YlxR family protein [Polyangia bacterium]